MLDNQEAYKHPKTNPTASTTKEVSIFVNNLVETKKTTKEASFRLKTSNTAPPSLHGLPKLHKGSNPFH